jgi:hypothetical protein
MYLFKVELWCVELLKDYFKDNFSKDNFNYQFSLLYFTACLLLCELVALVMLYSRIALRHIAITLKQLTVSDCLTQWV